jgi:hypothetical protein
MLRAIKQYLRNRISRIIASDTADVRVKLAAVKHEIVALLADFDDLIHVLRQQGIIVTGPDQLRRAAIATEESIALRLDFESYKDNRLLQLWHAAVGLPSNEVQRHVLAETDRWDPDLDMIEADLLRRCDLLPSNDPTRPIIAEFLIACGRIEEGVGQVLKIDQNSLRFAQCYLGGRACMARGRFREAYDNLQAATHGKDSRRAFFLAGRAARRCGRVGEAALLFDEAMGLNDFAWTDLANLSTNTSE